MPGYGPGDLMLCPSCGTERRRIFDAEKASKSDVMKERRNGVISTNRKNSKNNVNNVDDSSQSGDKCVGHSDDRTGRPTESTSTTAGAENVDTAQVV